MGQKGSLEGSGGEGNGAKGRSHRLGRGWKETRFGGCREGVEGMEETRLEVEGRETNLESEERGRAFWDSKEATEWGGSFGEWAERRIGGQGF